MAYLGLPLPSPFALALMDNLDLRVRRVSEIVGSSSVDFVRFLLTMFPLKEMRQQSQPRNDCQGQALCNGTEKRAIYTGAMKGQRSDTYAYQGSEWIDRNGRVGADQGTSIPAGVSLLVDGLPGISEPGLPMETDWPLNSYTRSSSQFRTRASQAKIVPGLVEEAYSAPSFGEALQVVAFGGSIHWGTYWPLNWGRDRIVRTPAVKGRGGHATEGVWATHTELLRLGNWEAMPYEDLRAVVSSGRGEWVLEFWNSHGDPGPYYVAEAEYEFLRDRRNSPFGAYAVLPAKPVETLLSYSELRSGFIV